MLLGAPAAALDPAPGAATVDGSPAEWTPADDVAAVVGNDPPFQERGRLSLRYDCDAEVLYALVMAAPDLRLQAVDPDEAYLRLGSDPKLVSGTDVPDGRAPDAAWVDRQGSTAAGIELSTPLTPGRHDELRVHAKLPDDSADGYETLDLSPRYQGLEIACGADPAVALIGAPPADPGAPPAPTALVRTGTSGLPVLVVTGSVLLVLGAALSVRRRGRSAGP